MKTTAFPWLVATCLGIYAIVFSYPKRYDAEWKEIHPNYSTPTIDNKQVAEVIEPTKGVKALHFWYEGKEWMLPLETANSGLDLRAIISSLSNIVPTGQN